MENTSKNIFYLEDEIEIRSLYTRKLQRCNYDVTEASTIAEAKQIVSDGTFDLLMIDLNLPDGDGEEVINFAKESTKNSNSKFLVISAHLDNSLIDHFKRNDVDTLSKPFSSEALIQAIALNLKQEV